MIGQQIAQVIEAKIQPLLKAHQGDIEVVEITTAGFVKVRPSGACATCPGAQHTLTDIVEAELRSACPEVGGVTPVYQVSDDLLKQALKILHKDRNG
jgi:Fe-S cluster biogenesis protein NfuA